MNRRLLIECSPLRKILLASAVPGAISCGAYAAAPHGATRLVTRADPLRDSPLEPHFAGIAAGHCPAAFGRLAGLDTFSHPARIQGSENV